MRISDAQCGAKKPCWAMGDRSMPGAGATAGTERPRPLDGAARPGHTGHRYVTEGQAMAQSGAERQRRYRERRRAGEKLIHSRLPADRRRRPAQWDAACNILMRILDSYQDWRDNMPPGAADSTTAERLD